MRTIRPKLGVFSKMLKIQLFCSFITQLVKMLQQWSLYDVKEDILPFVLNKETPLSNIWLLRYKLNSFGCSLTNLKRTKCEAFARRHITKKQVLCHGSKIFKHPCRDYDEMGQAPHIRQGICIVVQGPSPRPFG